MKKRTQLDFSLSKLVMQLMVMILCTVLIACGGKRKTTDDNGDPIVDMTRPPVMIKDIKEQTVESDPDEVISYEKWKKKRAEDQAKDAEEESNATIEPDAKQQAEPEIY